MTPNPSSPSVGAERAINIERFVWRGITIDVVFEADWLGSGARGSAFASAHLQMYARDPEGTPLPVTETGYRSHFVACGAVEAAGGPVAYVTAWLDQAAKNRAWRQAEARGRQLDLFGPG